MANNYIIKVKDKQTGKEFFHGIDGSKVSIIEDARIYNHSFNAILASCVYDAIQYKADILTCEVSTECRICGSNKIEALECQDYYCRNCTNITETPKRIITL